MPSLRGRGAPLVSYIYCVYYMYARVARVHVYVLYTCTYGPYVHARVRARAHLN